MTESVEVPPSSPLQLSTERENVVSLCSANVDEQKQAVLLSTAVVLVRDSLGNYHSARALIDPGSDATFVSENLVLRLGLPRQKVGIAINGIGDLTTQSRGSVASVIKSQLGSSAEYDFRAFVLHHITSNKPNYFLNSESWSHIKHLVLADPNFDKPSPIDILLGGDVYADILIGETIRGPVGTPVAISSSLGWLLIGKVDKKFILDNNRAKVNSFFVSSQDSLDTAIRKFWEIESIPDKTILSPEDRQCEEIFVRTHSRDDSGRYVVSLPFREGKPSLGKSRTQAEKRLVSMERRFARDVKFRTLYCDFMQDYLESGHMELVQGDIEGDHYFIPHHGILRPSSITTKLRVVFDASVVTTAGNSLNSEQLIGPKLQKDIAVLLLQFRLHPVAFTADIRQMYRQILVCDEHQNYQLILWRTSSDMEPQVYRLKTVTYGLSSSPYLAIRVLQQLADDHQSEFREASEVIRHNTYMDDVICGADSVDSAVNLQKQLFDLLKKGGFELRKWCSNSQEFLRRLPEAVKSLEAASISLDEDSSIKVLGLIWQPLKDMFSYDVKPLQAKVTKRTILSETARIFDPLGFLCPVIIAAKILLQELWLAGVDWDSEVPQIIHEKWTQLVSKFSLLSNVQIPRLVSVKSFRVELHGFCDSSEAAYSGVIYFRLASSDDHVTTHIIVAKSRDCPLKKLSIPRLELCGALLLAKLFEFIRKSLGSQVIVEKEVAWTDSSIVLTWLRASPHNWTTYVANRVNEVQNLISPDKWRHVRSYDNPADCASRGLSPSEIVDHDLWWFGPIWLRQPEDQWPISNVDIRESDIPESRSKKVVTTHSVESTEEPDFLTRFSSFHKLKKVMAYCLRFIKACQLKVKFTGALSVPELDETESRLMRLVQSFWFSAAFRNLKQEKPCSIRLQRLNPFLDEQGLIRVGGRLRSAAFEYRRKHPVVLPPESSFTILLVNFCHQINLHSGLQATLAYLARTYWIISARRVVKKQIFLCLKCYKNRPSLLEPLMADLPQTRVRQVRPFVNVAVDYAGPFSTKTGTLRNAKVEKSYICIFVCLTSRALHIELVSSLSTDAFMASFRRFIGRRGLCSHIYSDNGRNFVGASTELKAMFEFVKANQHLISQSLLKYKISWHFNPPAAPHFTGMAEAALKSIKSHLKSNVTLTFEEMSTVLTQIESVLNSRPICPMSSDPNDLEVLTPAHFLLGEPLNAFPEPDLTEININRLSRWQLLQNIIQMFWKRWSNEFLHTLQQRGKWTKLTENIKLDALVLIHEPNVPPLQWKLGRVLETHPSKDGVIRSVTLKTQQGSLKRPVHRLCPLPSSD